MVVKQDVRTLIHTPADLAIEHLDWAKRNRETPGVPWGIKGIDKKVIPMRPGDLVALIGRPGHGKSTALAFFARAESKRIAARGTQQKEAVVYVTWESSAEEIENFFAADDTYSASDIAWGRADPEYLTARAAKRAAVPIWVIGHGIGRAKAGTPRMTVDAVYRAIESMEEDYGVKPSLVLLDYIQIIPVEKAAERTEQVSEAVIRAKELAQRIGVPIVAGVQARRDVDGYKVPIPEKSDAQWSCVSGDTQIMDSSSGRWYSAEDVYELVTSGRCVSVHALDEETHKITGDAAITMAKRNPPDRLYRIDCGSLGHIRVSAGHRFYTSSGWKRADALSCGDYIAAPSHMKVGVEDSDLDEYGALILGLLLGDGAVTKALTFTNSDMELIQSYVSAVLEEWPGECDVSIRKQTAWDTFDATIRRADHRVFPGGNPAMKWARKIGLFGQSAGNKHVPEQLLLTDSCVANLLAGLFATDGSVCLHRASVDITFSTLSRRLAEDTKHLLARLGVFSTIREQKEGRASTICCLRVSCHDAERFSRIVPVPGRKGRILSAYYDGHTYAGRGLGDLLPSEYNSQAIDVLNKHNLRTRFNNVKGRMITRGRLAQIAGATGDRDLGRISESDLRWAKIISIDEDGTEPTYDFHVPGYENFVANGFVTHNSGIEQAVDKLFGLWRPCLSPGFEEGSLIEIEGVPMSLPVTPNLMVLRLLKQRFEDGRATWALHFAPQYLRLCELELQNAKGGE